MVAPRYQNLDAGQVTLLSSADGGALVRLIAGDVAGYQGPGSTHTPITVAHATLAAGAPARRCPWRADFNALAYVLAGTGTAGGERRPVEAGQLVVFGAGDAAHARGDARRAPLDVLLLGGRPIREPVAAVRPVRDEHPRRAAARGRGLPGRPPRHRPRRRPPAVPRLTQQADRGPSPRDRRAMHAAMGAVFHTGPFRGHHVELVPLERSFADELAIGRVR